MSLLPSSIYVIVFLSGLNFMLLQTSGTNCTLDIQLSATNDLDCGSGNWGGFIRENCCTRAFHDYLYALGRRANLSGDIFLNATEQKSCLISMKRSTNVSGCGIEKLTTGAGGCSDYTVEDVFNKLGKRLKMLAEDCKDLSSYGRLDQACIACSKRWEEIGGSSDDEVESVKDRADVCKYAVLVTLTESQIDDIKWQQAVFNCLRRQPLVIANEQEGKTSGGKTSTGLVILVGGLVGMSAIVLIAALILLEKRTKISLPPGKYALHESLSEKSSCPKITTKEVYLATNDLSTSNFIGQGVAGKVYKGILSNGQHVAVKHIINDGYVETFIREVRSLSHVKHPNLVALLGHCENNDDWFLVYELCHNGNLSEWLYSKDRVLSWIQRLEIAIDCAKGLWFLHSYPEGSIVHRDIKPTNILIDADFQAKLSDFGLSKVMDIGQSCVISEVRGTFGYVDPEYRRNHNVSASGDVYSFGIVLLQLLSGQRVFDLNVNKPMPLDKMAKVLIRGGNVKNSLIQNSIESTHWKPLTLY